MHRGRISLKYSGSETRPFFLQCLQAALWPSPAYTGGHFCFHEMYCSSDSHCVCMCRGPSHQRRGEARVMEGALSPSSLLRLARRSIAHRAAHAMWHLSVDPHICLNSCRLNAPQLQPHRRTAIHLTPAPVVLLEEHTPASVTHYIFQWQKPRICFPTSYSPDKQPPFPHWATRGCLWIPPGCLWIPPGTVSGVEKHPS